MMILQNIPISGVGTLCSPRIKSLKSFLRDLHSRPIPFHLDLPKYTMMGWGLKSDFSISPHHLQMPHHHPLKKTGFTPYKTCNIKEMLQKCYSNTKKECIQMLHVFSNLYLRFTKYPKYVTKM